MIAATLAASLVLPVSLFATQITEVVATRDDGRLAITVKADAMIDPESVTTKMGEGYLYLFVQDAHVREANRSWTNDAVEGGAGEDIRAHRHKQRIELAIPVGNSGCQGPIELEKTPDGLRALVGCDETPRPTTGRAMRQAAASVRAERERETGPRANPAVAAAPAAALALAPAAAETPAATRAPVLEPMPASKVNSLPTPAGSPASTRNSGEGKSVPRPVAAAALRPLSEREGLELKAKLALDPAPAEATPEAARPAPEGATPEATPEAMAAGARPQASGHPAPGVAPTGLASGGAARAAAAAPSTIAPAGGGGGGGSGGGVGVVLAGLLLVAIAAGAFFFSRRRAIGVRHIRILETASLGPKRALVVARIGDATMVLGSSEAGITLLQTLPEPSADSARIEADAAAIAAFFAGETDAVAAAAAADGGQSYGKIDVEDFADQPSFDALGDGRDAMDTDGLQPVGQAGLLARLFRRGTPANDPPAPRFEDLLEDSLEDQDLRRKLSLGLSGRVR